MLKGFVKLFGGDTHKRTMESLFPLVDQVNALEPNFESLSDEALRAKTDEFRSRISLPPFSEKMGGAGGGSDLNDLLPEAFAAVREAAKRTIRQRHYDVQIIGGAVLHRGEIAEMRTGEGKTLVATLPLYLNALTGKGVHLITVNDYLARRDARWMGPIFHALGLTVGILQMAAVTENGKKAFVYDPTRESPSEDQNQLRMVERVEAYAADVTYGTNAEFGFDYLRDNMAWRLEDRVQRGHFYAIVDEVDNVLIDEARTPLIISGPAQGDLEWYTKMSQAVKQLKPEDYDVNEKDRSISLTEIGIAHVEQLLGQTLQDPDRPEDVTPEQARLLGYLEQSLRAQHLFRRNKDYLVQGNKVIIIDENTGRLMPGRRWSDGLHQAVEAKEGVRIEPESVTYATITLQNYFRMYEKLAGMTGTALTEAEEFSKIYELEVVPIITNLEYQAARADAQLVEVKGKDEEGYPVNYFTARSPSPREAIGSPKGVLREGARGEGEDTPLFWRRKDYPDVIYRTVEAKIRAVVQEIVRYHVMGRPLLIGTTSVENSDFLSGRLRADPVRRLLQVMLIRKLWFEKNNREEDGRQVDELEPLYEPLEKMDPSFLRQFAKPLGLTTINLDDPANMSHLLNLLSLHEEHAARLKAIIQSGIQHKVLNARKHTEESKIIADAGAHGAVTIATSMAGRGVDIKLGGEIEEESVTFAKDFLQSLGVSNPYGLSNAEALEALLSHMIRDENSGLSPNGNRLDFFASVRSALVEKYGRVGQDDWPQLSNILYTKLGIGLKASESLAAFWKHTEQEMQVRALGGLAVLATERHEARRIDNQLRGRSARQGDPGSSRFYLSMEDDLMRIQGGDQVSNLMERLHVDDAFPLEVRMVSNLIEQSQHRVEGANFDVRKHLLEYDDVLNKQRTQIYSQRDRIFTKEDLRDDVLELLEAEVRKRVEAAFENEENTWRLLDWLDQVQPTFPVGDNRLFPSYTLKLVLSDFASKPDLGLAALDMARRALEIQRGYTLRSIETAVTRATEALTAQIAEREDLLDTFFSGLREERNQVSDRNLVSQKPQQMVEDLQSLVHVPLRLDNNQMRALATDPDSIKDEIVETVTSQLTDISVSRLVGAVENRIGESLGISKDDLAELSWDDLAASVVEKSKSTLARQLERMVGAGGQIERDAEVLLQRESMTDDASRLRMLLSLSQGVRSGFDARTHRQVKQVYSRFNYSFLATDILKKKSAQDVVEEVLNHLEEAEDALAIAWGKDELQKRGDPDGVQDEAKSREMGLRLLNEAHRRLLVGAISELWVDYLTRVEALRVSISLEAYAQRDPLVQYKSRASEMFQSLLEDIRAAVIGRLFAYQRRPSVELFEDAAVQETEPSAATDNGSSGKKKKRKRH